MKNKFLVPFMFAGLTLMGCGQSFDDLLIKSQKAFNQNNYTEVIDDLSLALPRWRQRNGNEKKAEAYQLLGQSYRALKRLDQAAESFRSALQCSEKSYQSAYELGVIELSRLQPQKAKEAFQASLRAKKDDALAMLGLGDSLFILGDYISARDAYKNVLRVSPGVEDALRNLEEIKKRLDQYNSKPSKKAAKHATRRTRILRHR